MDKRIWVGAGVGVMALAGVAMAQVPPGPGPGAPGAPPQPPAAAEQHDGMGRRGPHGGEMMGRPEMGQRMGWMHRMMDMHRPPESKAAHFRFRKGDAVVSIKCADDEPTKACVDAATTLLGALPK